MKRSMALWAAMAALSLAGCFAAPGEPGASQSQTVGAQGGKVTSSDGLLTLQIPPGALSGTQAVTLTVASGSPVPSSAQAVGAAYEIGPASLAFAAPVQVTVTLPSGVSASGALLFTAGVGHVAVAPLQTSAETTHAITGWISGGGLIQVGHAILLTGGPTGGTTGGTSNTASSSSSTTTATTGGTGSTGTTGGGTTSSGTTGYCGGAVGTIGGGGRPVSHIDEAIYCDNGPTNEVDCTQGNCRCLTDGVETSSFTLPSNDFFTAWDLCGYPHNPVFAGPAHGCTGACLAPPTPPSGTATVEGDLAFAPTVNTFVHAAGAGSPNPGSTINQLDVTLAQGGFCGGYGAQGKTVYLSVFSPGPIVPGTYPLQDFDTPQAHAELSVGDWEPAAGLYGVAIADRVSGSVVITSIVGDQISGTYSADVQLVGTPTHTALSGTFSSVPSCVLPE